MSKSHVKIAQYILQNPYSVPFFTVGKLAHKAGVSEATVVRFATFLGFSGYPELQQQLVESLERQLTTVERLEMSVDVYSEEEKVIYEVLQDDLANLRTTMEQLDVQSFRRAAEALLNAKKVYIVASRSAVSLAVFLQYYLDIILGNTKHVQSVHSTYEQLYALDETDVVVGISFSRYVQSTVDIVSYAKGKGATVLVITDHVLSPLVPYADVAFYAQSSMPTFIDSFAAPLSLINALIAYVGKQKIDDFHGRLRELEDIWDHFHVFYKKN